ncbi:hypothetical protein GIB67_028797 [Kingdonia uniflora]|uniref:FBD domain-containing protein n=1 Tax=Kingdonia uniflora TaxID=39325 RepID=A0A7J7LBK5_9MAGN|nr:hypothetical protein GIB67_028797 [Kingdonia uniflora]
MMRAKTQKLLHYEEVMPVGEDRISKLHDFILHHILSFLGTKTVVATSILSKRWRHLWTSVPNLEFSYDTINRPPTEEVTRFMNYVDRVLQFHDMSNLQKFTLQCCGRYFDESHIRTWISTLMRYKVPELHVFLLTSPELVVPDCLFTSSSLKVLEFQVRTNLTLPISISLPGLKTLHLCYITFTNGQLTEQLFSSSPVLEELIIDACRWDNLKTVCISSPSLKYFTLGYCETVTEDDNEVLPDREIVIQAPNLVSFNRTSFLHFNIILCKFESLVHANIDVSSEYNRVDWIRVGMGYRVSRLLEGLSNVKCLTITANVFEVYLLSSTLYLIFIRLNNRLKSCFALPCSQYLLLEEDCLNGVPAFPCLTRLKLSTIFPYKAYRALIYLLRLSPNLESIVFAKGVEEGINEEDDWSFERVPQSSLVNLKEVVFRECNGRIEEYMSAVKFFFMNSKVLERITMMWVLARPEEGTQEYEDKNVVPYLYLDLPRIFTVKSCSRQQESIYTFDQLQKQFIKTYAYNKDKEENLYSLIGLKQSQGEKLEEFLKKFLELARKVDNLDQKIVVTAFTNALWLDCKAKEYLFLNRLAALEEMITKVNGYRSLMHIFKDEWMLEYIVDLKSYQDGSYKKQLKVVQVNNRAEEKHLYYMHLSNMIEINQITNSSRSKRQRLSECCDLTS